MNGAIVVRATAGLAELSGPDGPLLDRLWDRPVDRRVRLASRVLATRDLLAAVALASRPGRRTCVVIASIDGLHAASMIGLAMGSDAYRRPALVSAAMATVLALTTAL